MVSPDRPNSSETIYPQAWTLPEADEQTALGVSRFALGNDLSVVDGLDAGVHVASMSQFIMPGQCPPYQRHLLGSPESPNGATPPRYRCVPPEELA